MAGHQSPRQILCGMGSYGVGVGGDSEGGYSAVLGPGVAVQLVPYYRCNRYHHFCYSRLFQEDSEAVIWMGEWSSSVRCNPCILLPDIRAHYEKEGREGILTAEVCILNNLFCANDI